MRAFYSAQIGRSAFAKTLNARDRIRFFIRSIRANSRARRGRRAALRHEQNQVMPTTDAGDAGDDGDGQRVQHKNEFVIC